MGVILIYWDNGRENGNYYLDFRAYSKVRGFIPMLPMAKTIRFSWEVEGSPSFGIISCTYRFLVGNEGI